MSTISLRTSSTSLQICSMTARTRRFFSAASVVLADEAFGFGWHTFRMVLAWITGVLTLASLAAYLRAWLAHMTDVGSIEDGNGFR